MPIVGNYAAGEPNSIVVMDNAVIHMSERSEEMINDAGGILLFTAPYSPHINPIEYFFSTYKAALARNSLQGLDWYAAHYSALQAVTPEAAMKTFQHCDYPGTAAFIRRAKKKQLLKDKTIMLCLVAAVWYSIHTISLQSNLDFLFP